jgi:saccharopine dehydrogenase-like NADP-dependent oxidoreductase
MLTMLVMGAGKIGSLIAFLLARSQDYHIYLADTHIEQAHLKKLHNIAHLELVALDAKNTEALTLFVREHHIQGIVSSLPFYANITIAQLAAQLNLHYFDLTEDVQTTQAIKTLAHHKKNAFVPQCGLAPGFINILAHHLMQKFSLVDTVKMRVGALPLDASNELHYSLTWSTDGLINEYGNPCQVIENGEIVTVPSLEGCEEVILEGLAYEAFYTSGGIGSLLETYLGKVRYLNYKTLRYPGHCAKMRFLMHDLKLNDDRDTLKRILENVLPKTYQDIVLVYVSVTGKQDGQLIEENYVRKFYAQEIEGHVWTAIQLTTASGICAIVDLVLNEPTNYHGFIRQEQFSFSTLTHNRFGQYYQ